MTGTATIIDRHGNRRIVWDDGRVELMSRETWHDFVDPGEMGKVYRAAIHRMMQRLLAEWGTP